MSEKKLNPKLDDAIVNLAGDHCGTPEWATLLDVIREMLIEAVTSATHVVLYDGPNYDEIANTILYSGGNDE